MLLEQAQIPFVVISQNADEHSVDHQRPIEMVTAAIARLKMDHVQLPQARHDGQVIYVLTADTLSLNSQGQLSGKPRDRNHAIEMLIAARAGMRTGTAFCLEKKEWSKGGWTMLKRIEQYVESSYEFIVPDEWIDRYLEESFGINASGAIAIEEFGLPFLKSVNGSYTSIVGLPLFEVRQALEALGFFAQ